MSFIIKKRVLYFILLIYILILTFVFILLIMRVHSIKNTISSQPEYTILIEIDEKKLYLLEDGKLIKKYPIASGMKNMPSPIGTWKIIDKGEWGKGFGGHWMGLDVPWGTYGIHGTTREESIGSAASHGCIRMYNKDIKELYKIVPLDTLVIINNGPFGPFGTGFRSLKPGDRGADVLAVQERLKELRYYKGNMTGIFGEDLKNAVHRFQADKNLEIKNTITREDYDAMGLREFE
ncbi:L,D-transpeptidase family protein [Anaerocolumna jejuensis]|uniref:L,D-transpeptidase family protein n=1 Tax=Anaerocolumna jejuensis TaxID=259063 RepID=UPI003F7C20F5